MRTSVFWTFAPGGKSTASFEQPAILVRMRGPEFQVRLGARLVRRREHGRLEVGHVAVLVRDVIAVGIADGLAAGALVDDMAHHAAELVHRILAAEKQEEHARLVAGVVRLEVLQHVLADLLLRGAVPRVGIGHDGLRVFLHQFLAGGEHARAHDIQPGAGDEPRNNAAGPRFADRMGGDDYVR